VLIPASWLYEMKKKLSIDTFTAKQTYHKRVTLAEERLSLNIIVGRDVVLCGR